MNSYKDAASADKHTTEQHFKDIFATLDKEKVLGKERMYSPKSTFWHAWDMLLIWLCSLPREDAEQGRV